jgi:hypothetical protein
MIIRHKKTGKRIVLNRKTLLNILFYIILQYVIITHVIDFINNTSKYITIYK